MAGIEHIPVEADEAGMRLDRWFKIHYPGLGFGQLQKLLRSGQVRVDGGRVKTDARVQPGQVVRVPPMEVDAKAPKTGPIASKDLKHSGDAELLARMLLHEDDKVFVLNKPAGLAVQGGSGVARHIDKMLEAWTSPKGEKPRLVHRLDRDTSGVLVIARTRGAAQKLTAAFRERDTKKTYWALVKGVPRKHDDKISTWLVKEQTEDGDRMRIAKHGEDGADHAVSYYRVLETAAQSLAWLEMEPYTGRTHQLRVHALHIGSPDYRRSQVFHRRSELGLSRRHQPHLGRPMAVLAPCVCGDGGHHGGLRRLLPAGRAPGQQRQQAPGLGPEKGTAGLCRHAGRRRCRLCRRPPGPGGGGPESGRCQQVGAAVVRPGRDCRGPAPGLVVRPPAGFETLNQSLASYFAQSGAGAFLLLIVLYKLGMPSPAA